MNLSAESMRLDAMPVEFRDEHQGGAILGFWLFLSSDLVLFSCLFAVYAVYRTRVTNGPTPGTLFHYSPVLIETILLLTSSFTCGLAVYAMRLARRHWLSVWLAVTLMLGVAFVSMEVHEFASYVSARVTWHHSAFLSAFFALVGTHGMHVSFGILWGVALLIQLSLFGITPITSRKIYTFSLYWHFLDIVWVFIFTFVYLAGKVG